MEPKERIVLGARELYFRYGIKRVTQDDLAKHMGMSKKTIYQNFYDKDELVIYFIESILNEYIDKINLNQKSSANAIDELLKNMQFLGGIFSSMNPSMLYDMQKYHPTSWARFREFKEKAIIEILERILMRGLEENLFRQDINVKILARLRVEEIEMAMNPGIYPADKFNLTEVQIKLLEHFLYGITTLKGHKLVNDYKQLKEDE